MDQSLATKIPVHTASTDRRFVPNDPFNVTNRHQQHLNLRKKSGKITENHLEK